ncbi:type VI secretion system tip protein TssI/VgrG [Chondromyces crocatus]|uniref:Uncharacterized protein n=1 Tax=Chondromyces crocatus TaxID=52 RepID=A0A0K1EP38_CHOCO|nr:type VI secretion system tip protein TssI/VgrG [Chondromyces crocatus]AKT42611.1 uncharacterized protein CMC5_068380 [Chondromyces crocatus]
MAILELTIASGEAFHVTRFAVREAVSSPFTVSIWARHADASLPLGNLIGQTATFRMVAGYAQVRGGGARTITGIISYAEQAHGLSPEIGQKGLSTYMFRIVPPLWQLQQRRGNRIYQHLSIPDIIDALLAEWQITPTWQIDRGQYPKLEFKVQYAESDYEFLSRLLEEAGIAFTFPEGEGGPTLTFSDRLEANEARAGTPVYIEDPEQTTEQERVTQVRFGREVRPGATMLRDVDFRNPAYALFGNAPPVDEMERRYEQVHYRPGGFLAETGRGGNTPVADDQGPARHDEKHGEGLAGRALEGERAGMRYVAFESNVLDLAPGAVLSIEDHPHPELSSSRRLLVLETSLEGAPEAEWVLTAHTTFADAPYRPPRRTAKPLIQGVQSATVVGPRGQEIHTDEFGRVRVQFHWDREGKRDQRSSCWIRASHGWAGSGFGWMALPRVGQEILISFLQGDPDQPMLAGHVYNAVQQVPYKLPDHKTRSTWKSDSSLGGGGFNEIMFEDLAGSELVWQQAQKDRLRLVRNDEQITVVHDRQKQVNNDEADETEGHRKRWVGKDLDTITQRHRRERVEGDDHLIVKGSRRHTIDGNRSLTVAQERHQKIEGRYASKANEQLHVVAGETLVGEGADDVTLKGPGGFLRMDASGITIKGTVVKINVGGSPGRGRGSRPELPALALQAPKAEVQAGATKAAGPSRAMVQEGAKPDTPKAERLAARKQLIADARARAEELPPNSPERQRLLAAADRLERNNHSVEMARLSQSVYDDEGAPEGWRRIPPEEMPPGLRDQVWEDKDSGFYAAMYESDDGQKVVAFRGTNEAKDWKTNIPQGLGMETDQYNHAHHIGQAMRNTYGPDGFEITGHSLGGGLASMAVVTSGAQGTTFNSAGLHPRTARRVGADFSRGADLIETYGVAGEVLTSVQTVPVMRQAMGKWHDLPAIGPGMGGTTGQGAMKGAGAGAAIGGAIGGAKGALIGGAIGGIGGGVVSMAKLSVERHGMDYVINGIESQKTEDIETMQTGTP